MLADFQNDGRFRNQPTQFSYQEPDPPKRSPPKAPTRSSQLLHQSPPSRLHSR